MSISGSLEDVAVADVLQFVYLGKRTGTLELERTGERARFAFHEGTLVSAQAPGAPRLGELLVEAGEVRPVDLEGAIEIQARESRGRSLGQILVDAGRLRPERLEELVRLQLERAVESVVVWNRGNFDFALDEIRPVDDIFVETPVRSRDGSIPANVVLLEAARIFDARDRRGENAALEDTGAVADAAIDALVDDEESRSLAGGVEVRALSADRDFLAQLGSSLASAASIRRVTLGRASEPPRGGASDFLLVDSRAGALEAQAIAGLRAARPEARIVALVDSNESMQQAYRYGATAAVPAEVQTVRACILSLLEADSAREAPAESDASVRRLQRVFGELRSGLASATVALQLMQLVSESFERAVLMLVRRGRLATLGAFGVGAGGRPLAVAMRRLELEPTGLLRACLDQAQVQRGPFRPEELPPGFAEALGPPPAHEQVVVFPIAGSERVIAIVYADNGDSARALRDVDLLEVAAAQVGIAFENELLRRQLGRTVV